MATTLQAIVGLGNPGPEYALTRHNTGALWIQHLALHHGLHLRPEKKFHGHYAKLPLKAGDLHLLFPSTFMNRSGMAVRALSNFYKIPPENILIAYDELDLEPGVIRLKQGGGHGGHNGIRDIINAYSGNKNFPRIRFGIGHPGDKSKVVNYVLSKIPQTEYALLSDAFDKLENHLEPLITGNWAPIMNQLHRSKP